MSKNNVKSDAVKKQKHDEFVANVKKNLFATILLAVTAPLTLFVFGPMNIFGSNMGEFTFVLGDFFYWNLLVALGVGIIIAAILLPLKGKIYDIFYTFFFATTVGLFLQGNYLNFGLHSLGRDDGVSFKTSTVVINIVIWIAIYAICGLCTYFLKKKHGEILKTIAMIALVTVVGMQLVSTVVLALTSEVFKTHSQFVEENASKEQSFLTYENLNRVSSDHNIVYFIVDRFDWRFCEQGMREFPEMFESLDGFTLYDDAMSRYPRTYPSVPYMLSGLPVDFINMSRYEYFDYAYSNSKFLHTLSEKNYDVNIYTDKYFGYENANSMKDYISNSTRSDDYHVFDSFGLAMKMAGLSLYRHLPFFAKNAVSVSTSDFAGQVEYDATSHRVYNTDMRDLYNAIKGTPFTTFEDKGNFAFVHFSGTHTPFYYDENFNPLEEGEKVDVMCALKQSMKIIHAYIDELKRLDLYENSTIIITGDHCSISSDSKDPFHAHSIPIFFKGRGSSGTALKTSSAPVTHDNVVPSIMKSEGLEYKEFGTPLEEVDENKIITRKYYFQRQHHRDNLGNTIYEEIVYEVTGKAKDFGNWKEVDRYPLNKSIFE